MSYSKGIMWLDDCRIPFVDEGDKWCIDRSKEKILNNPQPMGKQEDLLRRNHLDKSNQQGRFTPNLLVCGDVLNDGSVSKTNTKGQTRSEQRSWNYTSIEEETKMSVIQDKGTNSRYYDLDLWFDKMLEGV